ncbi:hypothetical protein [Alkalihalobacillus sp. AL-G]|uniref:hypothetical protein n=1 Tax=Alkalihalobacillus sp. AL-G TaxID=2926399 RepID=UPI00272B42C8|nr:hypothetical protein [Alkalihalobacillus sp. AL-G]WLD93725.1 hypothetical protein MOJ78_02060 [Alkalihalobacillus sp. AL-G]
MIWLLLLVPLCIVIGIALYFDKKNGAKAPDVNQGQNQPTQDKSDYYNSQHGGGDHTNF